MYLDSYKYQNWKCVAHKWNKIPHSLGLNFCELTPFLNVKIIYNQVYFDVLMTVRLSIFISVINQLDVQNFCFTISLFHTSTCFEHVWSQSGSHNCIKQPLVSSHL